MKETEYILYNVKPNQEANPVDNSVLARTKELAEAIKQTDVYREWLKARDELRDHHAAQVMLRDLQRAQLELMHKIQAGEPINPEDEARWQRTAEAAAYNPYVAAVLRAEQALTQLLAEISEIIAQEMGLAEQEPAQREDVRPARSRLWVPGQP